MIQCSLYIRLKVTDSRWVTRGNILVLVTIPTPFDTILSSYVYNTLWVQKLKELQDLQDGTSLTPLASGLPCLRPPLLLSGPKPTLAVA